MYIVLEDPSTLMYNYAYFGGDRMKENGERSVLID